MSIPSTPSSLLQEIAALFASSPASDEILAFRPSRASVDRANELLELNRQNALNEGSRGELDQFESAELLMRLVKARIRMNSAKDS